MFVQVGSWWYDKGKKLDSHIHKEFDRVSSRTQETIYVKQGAVKVLLYSETEKFIGDYILNEGDLAVFCFGGHGYEILEDDPKFEKGIVAEARTK